jgi:hypothetical protein
MVRYVNGAKEITMSDFRLPADLKFNRGLVENPTTYAKESGCVSWLFLVGDEFASMPGGMSYQQVQQAVAHADRVVSDPPRVLTLELARQQIEALDGLPRPTLVTCRTGPRGSATAYLYAGLKAGVGYEEVLAAAEADKAPFCGSSEIKEWVRSSLEALRGEHG